MRAFLQRRQGRIVTSPQKSGKTRLRRALTETLESRQLMAVDVPYNYAKVDTLFVPSVNATGDGPMDVTSGYALKNGVSYLLRVSGTYQCAWDPRSGDALFHQEWGGPPTSWVDYGARFDVDGVSGWGTTLDADHEYGATLTGSGSTISARIYDSYYADNAGGLTLEIFEQMPLASSASPGSIAPGGYVKVDQLTVQSKNKAANGPETSAPSNVVLQSGVSYFLEAVGTYGCATNPARSADASFHQQYGDLSSWVRNGNGLEVGGVSNWGSAYASNHLYGAYITGQGQAITGKILDTYYSDNSGSLTVNIYKRVVADLSVAGLAEDRDAPPGPNEVNPGLFVGVNDNDDNTRSDGDDTWDKDETVPANASVDPDWVAVSVDWGGTPAGNGNNVKLTGGDKVKLWYKNPNGTWAQPPSEGWTAGSSTNPPPSTVYVEGIAASNAVRDVTLTLTVTSGPATATDEIKVTAVDLWPEVSVTSDNDDYQAIDATYTFSRVGDTSLPMNVYFSIDSDAVYGQHFTASNTVVEGSFYKATIPAGSSSVAVAFSGPGIAAALPASLLVTIVGSQILGAGKFNFFSNGAVWTYQQSGASTQVTGTAAGLRSQLQAAANSGDLITKLVITGHGNESLIQLNANDLITVSLNGAGDSYIILDNAGDITDLFSSALSPSAEIILQGCHTGTQPGSIAEKMSIALPGRSVSGGKRYLARVGTNTAVGKKNVYVNGLLQ